MVKLLLVLFALCVVPSIVAARAKLVDKPVDEPLTLNGRAYLDTCNAGFETAVSTPLVDATVKIICTKRDDTSIITYSNLTKTDSSGNYFVEVYGDQGNDLCQVGLSGWHPDCAETSTSSSDRSLVILTRNCGLATNQRLANPLSCPTSTPLTNCAQLMQQYVDNESDD